MARSRGNLANVHVHEHANSSEIIQQTDRCLRQFYDAVNSYFENGKQNYKSGYKFIFCFEMASDDIEDSATDVNCWMQYTMRRESPQDVRFTADTGKAAKYFTQECIIPAYTYLAEKCKLFGYRIEDSNDRVEGAPIVCVPPANGVSKGLVSCSVSPKLYDGMYPADENNTVELKTCVFA